MNQYISKHLFQKRLSQKAGFTMIELVMVIVVLGILAALAIPRIDRDLRQEAKDNILAAIRYTQHLALMDNKTDPTDPNWQRNLWKITFSTSSTDYEANFYTVSSRRDADNSVDQDETAIDPYNGKYMYNLGGNTDIGTDESPNIFIGKKYGVKTINFAAGCAAAQHIAFDHMGRPHNSIGSATNDYGTYMKSDCNITVGFENSTITPIIFTIETETGRVSGN